MSKADLDLPPEIAIKLPEGALNVSIKSGHNVDRLREEIEGLMGTLRNMLIERGAVVKEDAIGEIKTNMGR